MPDHDQRESTPDRSEVRDLLADYHRTGDAALRDRIVEMHLGLAEYLARRFDRRGEPIDDLVQVASVALINSVDRFDPDRGLEFTTYAVPTIVGELKRHFRDKGWALRVPRRLQELHLRLAVTVADLTHELGRSPSIPEIAERAQTSPDEVIEAIEVGRAYRSSSLDAPAPGDDGPIPTSWKIGGPDESFTGIDERSELASLLRDLPERERTIVLLRFYEGLTQSEIAERIGISQMHVSRLLARTLELLRQRAAQDDAPPA